MLYFTMKTQAICVNEGIFSGSKMSCWGSGSSILREGSSRAQSHTFYTQQVQWYPGVCISSPTHRGEACPLPLWVAWEPKADKKLWIRSKWKIIVSHPLLLNRRDGNDIWLCARWRPLPSASAIFKTEIQENGGGRRSSKLPWSLMDRHCSYPK